MAMGRGLSTSRTARPSRHFHASRAERRRCSPSLDGCSGPLSTTGAMAGPVCTFSLITGVGDDLTVVPCVLENGVAEELAAASGMFYGVRVDIRGSGRIAHVELGDVAPHHTFKALALDTFELVKRSFVPSGPYDQIPPDCAAFEHSAEVDAWLREALAGELPAGRPWIAVRGLHPGDRSPVRAADGLAPVP
jgi:hypothetical protein